MASSPRISAQGLAELSATLRLIPTLILAISAYSSAKVTASYSNCHTMYNSQYRTAMGTYTEELRNWEIEGFTRPALSNSLSIKCFTHDL